MLTFKMFFVFIWSLLCTLPPYPRALRLKREGREVELRDLSYRVGQDWARLLVEQTGSTVEVIGAEHIPKDRPVVVVANHQGTFDVLILFGYLGFPVAFIAKEELRRFPILGAWMALRGCVFIRRGHPREALKAINEGAERIRNGNSMVIFPEGTRSLDGRLLPFKPGSLKLAQKSGAWILPVTLCGSRDIMLKGRLKVQKAAVRMVISPPVEPMEDGTRDLIEVIRSRIEENLIS